VTHISGAMKNMPDTKTEYDAPGEYQGQCRSLFNIIEQWDGKRWRSVPVVVDRRPQPTGRLHFGPEDFGRD
jgi:hypothetical protein